MGKMATELVRLILCVRLEPGFCIFSYCFLNWLDLNVFFSGNFRV